MGKNRKITEKLVREEAKKYSSRSDFCKNDHTCYLYALKNNIIDELIERKIRKLTDELVREEAKKYSSRTEFCVNDISCYQYANKKGFISELFNSKVRKLTDELVREEAKKYSSRTEFYKKDPSCYYFAIDNGFIAELYDKKIRTLTLKFAIEESKKYKSKIEFMHNDTSCYRLCIKYKIIDDLFHPFSPNDVPDKDKDLYIIYDKKYDIFKIGISKNTSVRLRYIIKETKNNDISIIETFNKCGAFETILHKKFKKFRLNNHPLKHSGDTEWFVFEDIEYILEQIKKVLML